MAPAPIVLADPWAMALDALFNGPGSMAAVYVPNGGEPRAIRVVRSTLDRTGTMGRLDVVQNTEALDIRVSEVEAPVQGDAVYLGGSLVDGAIVGGAAVELFGDAVGDVEGLTWTIGTSPIR